MIIDPSHGMTRGTPGGVAGGATWADEPPLSLVPLESCRSRYLGMMLTGGGSGPGITLPNHCGSGGRG